MKKRPSKTFLVVASGDAQYTNQATVNRILDKYHHIYKFTHLVHGGDEGADQCIDRWTHEQEGVHRLVCGAMWRRDKDKAAAKKFKAMSKLGPDLVLLFQPPEDAQVLVKFCKDSETKLVCIRKKR